MNELEKLSEEVLHEFGFVIGDNRVCNTRYYYLKFHSRILMINLNSKMCCLADNYMDGYADLPHDKKHTIQIPIGNFEYVYQLEKLYEGLTGEKLIRNDGK